MCNNFGTKLETHLENMIDTSSTGKLKDFLVPIRRGFIVDNVVSAELSSNFQFLVR